MLLSLAEKLTPNIDSVLYYTNKAEILSTKINYPKGIGDSKKILGICLYRNSNNSEALKYFYQAESIYTANNLQCDLGEINFRIGEALDDLNLKDKALARYHTSIKLLEKINHKTILHSVYNAKGLYYWGENDCDSAIIFHTKALNIRKELNLPFRIGQSYNNLGVVYWNCAQLYKALENYNEALHYYNRIGNYSGMALVLNNQGIIYYGLGEYNKALEHHKRALLIGLITSNIEATAYSYGELGQSLTALKAYKSALYVLNKSTFHYSKLPRHLGVVSGKYRIANIHNTINNPAEAIKYVQEGLELAKQYNSSVYQAVGYYHLGNSYLLLNQIYSAISYLKRSEALSSSIKLFRNLEPTYLKLSESYEKLNRYREAYEYYKKYSDLKENFSINILRRSSVDFHAHYLLEKNKRELQKKEDEIKNKTETQRFSSIGMLFFFVFAFFAMILFLQKRKANEMLIRKTKELDKAYAKLEETTKELITAGDSKDKFLSILAHDLKYPFHILLGYSSILISDRGILSKNEIINITNEMLIATENAYSLLLNLLNWARAQKGELKLQKESIALRIILQNALDQVHVGAKQKKLLFVVDKSVDQLNIYADKNIIFTVLRNLLSNAVKFSSNNGIIKITAIQNNKWSEISIIDAGIGIEQEIINSIIQFGTSHKANNLNNEASSGFGLILCKDLVSMHNGILEIKSAPNKGSSFTIKLPI